MAPAANRNEVFEVLWRNNNIPATKPGEPPNSPNPSNRDSGTRRLPFTAQYLSQPAAPKAKTLITPIQAIHMRH